MEIMTACIRLHKSDIDNYTVDNSIDYRTVFSVTLKQQESCVSLTIAPTQLKEKSPMALC